MIAFQIIASAGGAKGLYLEALEAAKNGDFEAAKAKIEEGDECFTQGHKAHADVLTRMANGEEIVMDVLMVHAEDQMMSTETVKIFVEQLIDLLKKA